MFRSITGCTLSGDADESSISKADSGRAKRIDYEGLCRYIAKYFTYQHKKNIGMVLIF
jgi:hypothetical protein